MKKKTLFSLRSPYREQLEVIGYRFGSGRKALAIVGAMRGNEVQQMYVCSRMVQALKKLESEGKIAEDCEIMVIPCINYYSMNIGKRFWAMDNTDINRMFPGYNLGETTQRIADGVFSQLQGYEYGIQLASFYQPGIFLPHVKLMDTGFTDANIMKDFGLQFGIIRKPQTDWRTILNDFVQEEIADYSFSPPDRRFDDSPFFLPDLNEKEDMLEDILFMIDTSASVSDDMVAAAYSEVKGAIDQFDGKLKGWLGFFDAGIIGPKPFESFEDLKKIKPAGGGGTDFQIIFDYVSRFMSDRPPACIIILTDGIAPFPHEREANGIPVLWLLCSEDITPPWGKVARISVP